MDIVVVGVSYQNTPIDVREKLSFSKKKLESAYEQLSHLLDEVVILSTCNRSEIYAVCPEGTSSISLLKDFFAGFHGFHHQELTHYFYIKENRDCVEHLFLVTAGLDSQVLGEDQILGQVKEAHETALEKQATGRVLNKLFRDSITYGKKVRQETRISQNPTSISYIAVQYLAKQMEDVLGKNLLLVGAGKMNRLALTYLKDMGFHQIFVANRTCQTAESLKEIAPGLEVIDFHQIEEYLPLCDVVISSTAAPHLVLKKERITRYKKNSIFIDLAVPRDIDPSIAQLEGITLIDLDDLKRVQEENYEKRRLAGEAAGETIQNGITEFYQWLQCIPLFPVIKQIENYHEHVLNREMPKLIGRLKNTDDEAKIAVLLKSFVKKIYSPPLIRLKQFSGLEKPENFAEILEAMYKEETV
ncbi:glutamyl-tRNA reductase [Candidatus Formimonas warabiya]|uniref:Glutamyl-tRNA reductase n=1 Tax=Formimonas warabiya TaxID=1761012 RepID=A0A3G1KZZ0_FORW1|nr:glutamyl-tRNA reductase [Candidatus Formimonas warabiya]ATW28103.1 glutamyl-tRNA reductase [Candidatus Formimonas warabiya]